jgi:hypothetical protein
LKGLNIGRGECAMFLEETDDVEKTPFLSEPLFREMEAGKKRKDSITNRRRKKDHDLFIDAYEINLF